MHVHLYTCTQTNTHKFKHIFFLHESAHMYILTPSYTHENIDFNTHTQPHTLTHTCTGLYTHTLEPTNAQTHAQTHKRKKGNKPTE